jgi:TRAP-type transport system periplasmic protein
VILGLGEVGWNDVVCKKACLTPDAVKGMKVRVAPSPASKMFWTSLGANGVQMPLSELFPALQSGLVDGGRPALPVLRHHAGGAERTALRADPAPAPWQRDGRNKAVWDGLTPRPAEAAVQASVIRRQPHAPEVEAESSPRWTSSRPRAASCMS